MQYTVLDSEHCVRFQYKGPPREAFPKNLSLSLAFFRHAGKQQRLYKAMVGKRGGEVVQKYLYQYIFDLMKNHLKQRFPTTADLAVPREVITHYFVSSFLALLTWWLDHDMPYTADEMDGMFDTLTMPGLKNALRSR